MKRPVPPQRPDAHGPGWRPSAGYLVAALALVLAAVGLLLLLWRWPQAGVPAVAKARPAVAGSGAAVAPPLPSAPVPAPAGAQGRAQAAPRAPEGDADPTPDLKSYVARGEQPSMGEVIQRLHERGIHTGLGAFSPPGTRPPLVGLAVPEDFVLPKGYVRHHQATDDGQRIEAILMFAPDFQLHDAAGQPLPMPKDRVVPPELAPPGLPLRRIVIPPPADQARPGH